MWPILAGSMTVSELGELLEKLRRDCQTDVAMAGALRISSTHVNRILEDPSRIGLETCLRIAELSGRNASDILRATNKQELADLIERLYGTARQASAGNATTPPESDDVIWWKSRDVRVKTALQGIAEHVAPLLKPPRSPRRTQPARLVRARRSRVQRKTG